VQWNKWMNFLAAPPNYGLCPQYCEKNKNWKSSFTKILQQKTGFNYLFFFLAFLFTAFFFALGLQQHPQVAHIRHPSFTVK